MPIAQVLTNQRACSGSCQTLPIANPSVQGGIELFLKIKKSNPYVEIYILSTEDWSAQLPTAVQ